MAFVGRLLEELSNAPGGGGVGGQRASIGALGPMSRVPYPSPRLPPRDPPATPQCPPPWRAVWDQQYGRFFYINELNGHRQWDYPLVSPGYGFESRQYYSSPSPPASTSSRSNSVSSSYHRSPPLAPPPSYDYSLMLQKAASSGYSRHPLGGSRRPTPPPSNGSSEIGGAGAAKTPQFQFVYQDGQGGFLSPETLDGDASGDMQQKQKQKQKHKQKQTQSQKQRQGTESRQQSQQAMSRSPSYQSWTDSVLGDAASTPDSLFLGHDEYNFSSTFDRSAYEQQRPHPAHQYGICEHDQISLDGFETVDCNCYRDDNQKQQQQQQQQPQPQIYINSQQFAHDFSTMAGVF